MTKNRETLADPDLAPRPGARTGITLVELLVVMVISLIVTGVAFSLYRLNASYYLREDAYLQQYQNLRVALYTVGRDARMAGNGYSLLGPDMRLMQIWTPSREKATSGHPPSEMEAAAGWFRHADIPGPGGLGARAIFGVDGGSTDPDTLTIFRSEVESGNQLSKVKGVSGNTLELDDDIPEEAIKTGDIIAVGNGDQGVLMQVGTLSFSGGKTSELPIKTGGRFTSPSMTPPFSLTNAFVFNFRDVGLTTYYVDMATNSLMADFHDVARDNYDDAAGTSSIIASNIEDFQVYYFFKDDTVDFSLTSNNPDISSTSLNTERVKAISLGLVARSPYGDGPNNKVRPALFNRSAGLTADNRLRSVLIETIYLRNFNI
ncbi:MAG: PilW family protein [Deltaproteobacteria bacterium]|nr:PilW family protein [Deltaproteobacteria bacterium]